MGDPARNNHESEEDAERKYLSARQRANDAWGMSDYDGVSPAGDRPSLSGLDGGGESSPRTGSLHAVGADGDFGFHHESSDDDNDAPAEKSLTPGAVGKQEVDAADGANGADDGFKFKQEKSRRGIRMTRRQGIAGGLIGLLLGGGIFFGSIASGPFEFIHLAQTLHLQHFGGQDNANDVKMGRLMRFARSGQAGETRVGYAGSKMYAHILSDLKSIGLEPHYSTGSVADGFSVDPKNDNSPVRNMSDDQIKAYYADKGFSVDLSNRDSGGRLIIRTGSGPPAARANAYLASESKGGFASKFMGTRALNHFGLAPKSWHILRRGDLKVFKGQTALYRYLKGKYDARFKGEADPIVSDGSKAKEQTGTDSKGNPIEQPSPVEGVDTSSTAAVESKISGLKSGGFKAVGGIGTALLVACTTKAVADKLPELKYDKMIIPLMNLGMSQLNIGYQTQYNGSGADAGSGSTGNDVSNEELAYLSQKFNTVQSDGSSLNWSDNAVDRAAVGQSGGMDVPQSTKDSLAAGIPSWLGWTQNSAVGTACSDAGQAIAGGVGFVLSVFSGSVVSFAAQALAGALLIPYAVDGLSSLISDAGIDVADATGPLWRLYTQYGVQLGANASALSMGYGVASADQVSAVNAQYEQQQDAQWESKSMIARMFDPNDQRSLVSHAMDTQNPMPVQNLENVASGFLNIGSSLLDLPTKVFSAKASAAESTTYQYPFKIVSPTLEDINDPPTENPYANADAAAKLLDANPDYIQKAKACYAVDISKTPDDDGIARWNVTPDDAAATHLQESLYAGPGWGDFSYDTDGCKPQSSHDWAVISSFIGDTNLMNCYAQYNDFGGGCQDAATDNGSDTTSGNTGTSTPVNNNAAPDYCKAGTATGSQKIVCSAWLFDDFGYGSGHGDANFMANMLKSVKACDATNFGADPSKSSDTCTYTKGQALVDCSGLVDAAIYDAYGKALVLGGTSGYPISPHLHEIPIAFAKPGDIAWWDSPDRHTEVITSYDAASQKLSTFGSHDPSEGIGAASYPSGNFPLPQKVFQVVDD